MTDLQLQQAQEEAHQLSIIADFGQLVLALGPNSVLRKLPFEVQEEISIAIDMVMLEKGSNYLLKHSNQFVNREEK